MTTKFLYIAGFVFLAAAAAFAQGPPTGVGGGRGVDVRRASAATPEVTGVTPDEIEYGKPTEVVLKTRNLPPGELKLTVNGECKLISHRMVGNDAHFVVTSVGDEGGSCTLYVDPPKGRNVFESLRVKATPAIEAERRKREEEERRKGMEQGMSNLAHAESAGAAIGKKWIVKLPNGKTETWTYREESMSGAKFKSSSGDEITIMLQPDDSVIVMAGETCAFNGTLKNGKVSGTAMLPADVCKHGQGEWSAIVQR